MSATIDANILVYAANEDDDAHAPALELVERLGAGREILYLFWPTVMAFLRIATHPSIFPSPLSSRAAVETIGDLIARPHVRSPGEIGGFWETYLDASGRQARSDGVPDTHLVALMRQHGVRVIYTRDRAFRRFDGIEVSDPLA